MTVDQITAAEMYACQNPCGVNYTGGMYGTDAEGRSTKTGSYDSEKYGEDDGKLDGSTIAWQLTGGAVTDIATGIMDNLPSALGMGAACFAIGCIPVVGQVFLGALGVMGVIGGVCGAIKGLVNYSKANTDEGAKAALRSTGASVIMCALSGIGLRNIKLRIKSDWGKMAHFENTVKPKLAQFDNAAKVTSEAIDGLKGNGMYETLKGGNTLAPLADSAGMGVDSLATRLNNAGTKAIDALNKMNKNAGNNAIENAWRQGVKTELSNIRAQLGKDLQLESATGVSRKVVAQAADDAATAAKTASGEATNFNAVEFAKGIGDKLFAKNKPLANMYESQQNAVLNALKNAKSAKDANAILADMLPKQYSAMQNAPQFFKHFSDYGENLRQSYVNTNARPGFFNIEAGGWNAVKPWNWNWSNIFKDGVVGAAVEAPIAIGGKAMVPALGDLNAARNGVQIAQVAQGALKEIPTVLNAETNTIGGISKAVWNNGLPTARAIGFSTNGIKTAALAQSVSSGASPVMAQNNQIYQQGEALHKVMRTNSLSNVTNNPFMGGGMGMLPQIHGMSPALAGMEGINGFRPDDPLLRMR